MLILATKLGLKSAQTDITAAFVHSRLKPDKHIYVRQPEGYKRYGPNDEELVLKLKQAVHCLKQSPRYFFKHLKKHLEVQGLVQSSKDPCLFVGSTIIILIYIDDLLMFSKDDSEFDKLLAALKAADISIRREGTAKGFLGVQIDRTETQSGPQIILTQSGLTKRIIEALGLCSTMSTKIDIPAEAGALPKDAEGPAAEGQFNYSAVIGMLLYICGHSRPDI
jgi:5'-3' exoribonuclease 2